MIQPLQTMETQLRQSADYFPVRRISQACVSCRLRKCRCTGDRPVCGHCRRLGLECVYADKSLDQRGPRPGHADVSNQSPKSTSGEIGSRLDAIENTLREFGRELHSISSILARTVDSAYLHSDDRTVASRRTKRRKRGTVATMTQPDTTSDTETESAEFDESYISKEALLAVVDAYFAHCQNQPYSFFHEENFRHNLSQQLIPEHLLLAVMAIAVRYCSHPYFVGNTYETAVEYANRSWKSVITNCFTVGKTADLSIVQTIALLGLFDFTAGNSRHGSAWVKIGMAVRIAQDCGLMLDTMSCLPFPDQEERRRVFWSIYLLDRLVSCGRGRPPAILDASCSLQLPCEDSAWKSGLCGNTLTLDEVLNRSRASGEPQGTFAQVIVMAHVLGRSAQYMLQEFNIRSRYPPWDPSSDFAAIESDLVHLDTRLEMQRSTWATLAPHVTTDRAVDGQKTGPILFSRALFHLCYCLLNHPFLLRRRIKACEGAPPVSFLTRAFDSSWQHAQAMLELIRDARSQGCKFQSSFSGYCATVAGSIAAIQVHARSSGTRVKAQALVRESIAYLIEIGQYWHNVSAMAVALQRFSSNSSLLSELCSSQTSVSEISSADTDMMWPVVDYSTISNEIAVDSITIQNVDDGLRFDSWVDLFGTTEDRCDFGFEW